MSYTAKCLDEILAYWKEQTGVEFNGPKDDTLVYETVNMYADGLITKMDAIGRIMHLHSQHK